jgi:hypothetical protein
VLRGDAVGACQVQGVSPGSQDTSVVREYIDTKRYVSVVLDDVPPVRLVRKDLGEDLDRVGAMQDRLSDLEAATRN